MILAHEDRLCRLEGNELVTVSPPQMTVRRLQVEGTAPIVAETHTHYDHRWCQFALTAGDRGRMGIDERTGRVEWAFAEPTL
jgi:hypothetical protein